MKPARRTNGAKHVPEVLDETRAKYRPLGQYRTGIQTERKPAPPRHLSVRGSPTGTPPITSSRRTARASGPRRKIWTVTRPRGAAISSVAVEPGA
jgi:hypothetical protein